MKTVLATLLSLAMVGSAVAQNQPPKYHFTVRVSVKSGMNAQYEAMVKKVVEAAKKNGDQNWFTFNVSAGGAGNQYGFVIPFNTWEERDGWANPMAMLQKAFGEDEAAKIMRDGSIAEEGSGETIVSQIETLASSPRAGSGGIKKFYLVRHAVIRPGKAGDYRLALSKIRAAEDKAGGPVTTTRRTILGDRNEFTSTVGYDTGAERDRWPGFGDFMGAMYTEQETRQILEMLNDAMESSDWYEVAYRPDLSNPPGATTSN